MKRYVVNVHYDAITSVRVIAETEEEALNKAKAIAFSRPQSEFDFQYSDACVADVENIKEDAIDDVKVLAFPYTEYDRDELESHTLSELEEIASKDPNVFVYENFDQFVTEVTANPELLKDYIMLNV